MPEGSWSLNTVFNLSSKHRFCVTLILPGGNQKACQGEHGERQENHINVFFQTILLHGPLKSLLSILQQLHSHKYINSKQPLISPESFQVLRCCWSSWNSHLFSFLPLHLFSIDFEGRSQQPMKTGAVFTGTKIYRCTYFLSLQQTSKKGTRLRIQRSRRACHVCDST